MAAIDTHTWIPEEWDSDVIQRVNQVSVVESAARRVPMAHSIIHEPRSSGAAVAAVAKSAAYAEDATSNDLVTLTAVKMGEVFRIPLEDINDNIVDVIKVKQRDWATSYAKFLDNACLGTSAASNGGTIPFLSVYQAIRTTNAATSYTGDANYVTTTNAVLTASTGYAKLDAVVKLVETGDFWDEGNQLIIAHPSFRSSLRLQVDANGRPIFVQGQGGDAGTPDMLFGIPIRYSLGAKATTVAKSSPASTDHALMIVCNPDYLYLGVRSGPESATATADAGASFLTDETLLKMRSRRGFAVANEFAFAVLENTG
jgi:HK97 family phage major capsid protein